jgi:hypothetical protein
MRQRNALVIVVLLMAETYAQAESGEFVTAGELRVEPSDADLPGVIVPLANVRRPTSCHFTRVHSPIPVRWVSSRGFCWFPG